MKTKEINKEHIMVGIIIIFAIIFRIYMWPNALSEVNCDEAMTALNAKSIAETGTDIYGTSFPVYFEAWKLAGQSALLTYLMVFCIKIFGFSIFSIRAGFIFIILINLELSIIILRISILKYLNCIKFYLFQIYNIHIFPDTIYLFIYIFYIPTS